MGKYDKLIEEIVNSQIIDKKDAWDFCNELFHYLSGESIEAYLQDLEKSKDFQKITKASTETRRNVADATYAKNLKVGLQNLKNHKQC